MEQSFDCVLLNGEAATPAGLAKADIGIVGGRIAALGNLAHAKAKQKIDLAGLTILPGVIDSQVHLREPGGEHKEDLASGTAAAALGGVTAVCEMPNTNPATDNQATLADKLARAQGRAWVDHAFYVGASAANLDQLAGLENLPGCAGVKLFMGSSTGNLLVAEDEAIFRALSSGRRRMAIHAEDEARLILRRSLAEQSGDPSMHPIWRDEETAYLATERVLRLARKASRRVHVLHITTGREMALLAENKDIATVEVTPQHLTLTAPDCYERLGTLAQMNPPIRDAKQQDMLWKAIAEGVVDVIGSDHAPHTREEKAKPYPKSPSGMTGVQTLLPIMLDHVAKGRLSLLRLVDLVSAGPARALGMALKGRIAKGYDADFSIVDLNRVRMIENKWIASRCGWTPFDGMTVTGWPKLTVIGGRIVMRDDALLGEPAGEAVKFLECL